jgi:mRNA interferase MazF
VTRGDIYLVKKPGARDPKRQRAYVVLSRHALLQSRHSSVVCAPVYSQHDGLSTQVLVGIEEGLKHDSSIHCDDLVSLPKSGLTHYLGRLDPRKTDEVNRALRIALELEEDALLGDNDSTLIQ